MNKRVELNRQLDSKQFSDYFYLKEELVAFCRSEGLQVTGSKEDLNQIIKHYLDTGEKLLVHKDKRIECVDLKLESLVVANMRFSEVNRAFFKQYLGESFRFTVPFQRWLKENVGKTLQEAIDAYPTLVKNQGIDKQFEYNKYIRDYFKDSKQGTLKEAVLCWKYKKSLPGSNTYERSDRHILKTNKC